MQTFHEAARNIPVVQSPEVVICGGGPAGVAAALASARAGAKTCLLELHGCLGGVWTSGALSWIIDSANKPGIMAEITGELNLRGARAARGRTDYAYDVEEMKLLLEEKCLEADVQLQYLTRVTAAARGSGNRLAVAITESKSGRQAWAARAFVDATGDGDLAAQAGCGFDLGHPETGQAQPMSLMCLFTGVRFHDIELFVGGGMGEPKRRLLAELARAGVAPSYSAPTIFRIRDGLFAMMANHEYGVSALDAAGITDATIHARSEIHRLVRALRSLGEPWARIRLVGTGAQIGVREGRRIHGRYQVSLDDLMQGARHEDAVCRVNFGIDVHSLDPRQGRDYEKENRTRTKPYDIPLRALIAKDVDGLLLAGRCISGDFLAHSSYRVTGNAVALGEAAGTVAALSALHQTLPQDLPWTVVKSALGR